MHTKTVLSAESQGAKALGLILTVLTGTSVLSSILEAVSLEPPVVRCRWPAKQRLSDADGTAPEQYTAVEFNGRSPATQDCREQHDSCYGCIVAATGAAAGA